MDSCLDGHNIESQSAKNLLLLAVVNILLLFAAAVAAP
jgi:hypothetical protein